MSNKHDSMTVKISVTYCKYYDSEDDKVKECTLAGKWSKAKLVKWLSDSGLENYGLVYINHTVENREYMLSPTELLHFLEPTHERIK